MKTSLISVTAIALALLSAPTAFASSTDKAEQRIIAWTQSIERELLANLKYVGGDRLGARRAPVVRFTVDADGVIGDIELVQSSGFALADRAALRAVDLTNRVARPPQAATRTVMFKPKLITPDLRSRHLRG